MKKTSSKAASVAGGSEKSGKTKSKGGEGSVASAPEAAQPPPLLAEFNALGTAISVPAGSSRAGGSGAGSAAPKGKRTAPGAGASGTADLQSRLPPAIERHYALMNPDDMAAHGLVPEHMVVVTVGDGAGGTPPRPAWAGPVWPHKALEQGVLRIPAALPGPGDEGGEASEQTDTPASTTASGSELDLADVVRFVSVAGLHRIPSLSVMPPPPAAIRVSLASLHDLPPGYRSAAAWESCALATTAFTQACDAALRRLVISAHETVVLPVMLPRLPATALVLPAGSSAASAPQHSSASLTVPVRLRLEVMDAAGSGQRLFPVGPRGVTSFAVVDPFAATSCSSDSVGLSKTPSSSLASIPSPVVIGGLSSDVVELMSTIDTALRRPGLYTKHGLRPPTGCLFVGPPGTGKTLSARAIASRLGLPLRVLNGPEVLSPVIGEAEATLRRVFAEASAAGPALLFIDEIDGLCPRRETAGEVEGRVVATLLALMDGIGVPGLASAGEAAPPPPSVFVLAATNRAAALDPALRRPGRFDTEILLGVPTVEQRADILSACLSASHHALTQDEITSVASGLHGYVGADIAAACREAALAALRRVVGAGGGAGSGGIAVTLADVKEGVRRVQPSAIREVAVEVPHVSWDDIGGQEDTKQRLKEAVEWPLTYPGVFTRLGVRAPKGVLLFGPPGCSKTMMAKAMATEGAMNFIAIKGPELFSKYVGDSEKAVADVFRKARGAAPCILFFDEFDSMAGTRDEGDGSGGGSSVGTRVVSQMLQEIDGIQALRQVVVVAATNRPDLIDAALLRPGRIDRMLYVGPPDAAARRHILQLQLAKTPHDTSSEERVDVEALVTLLDGYSGAELVGICREAAVRAVQDFRKRLGGSTSSGEALDLSILLVKHRHFVDAAAAMPRQITPSMLRFYASFIKS